MKSLFKNLSLLATVASMIFLYSCGGEDPEDEPNPDAPSVTVEVKVNGTAATSPATVEAGDEVTADIDVTAPGNFNVFRVYVVRGTSTLATLELTRTQVTGVTDFTTPFTGTVTVFNEVPDSLAGQSINLEFEVVDDEDQTGSDSDFELTVSEPEARSYSAVLLSVPTGDFMNENFFSTSNGEIYSADEVTSTSEAISPLIDFGYYYGTTDNASIASPAGFVNTVFSAQVDGWNTKNATVIKSTTLGSSEFTELSSFADIDVAFDAGTDEEGIITGLAVGDVVAFETAEGKRGLILVTGLEAGTDSNDYIEIDVLVQEDAE